LCSIFFSTIAKGQTLIDSVRINPNPFQNKTLMYYSFINNDIVTINVINVVGAIVYRLTSSIMPAGLYKDSLNMTSYAEEYILCN
jgi:hypothetical protein